MYESPSIPVMKKPVSSMEVGPNGNNLAASATSRHPVDDLQRRVRLQGLTGSSNGNPFQNLEHVRRMYGSGLAMRLATGQKLAVEQDRSAPAGLPSSGLYREIVTGQDVQLDFTDFLSLPEFQPEITKENPHKYMEQHLGMM